MEIKAVVKPVKYFQGGHLPPYTPDGDSILICLLEGEWYWLGEGGSYADWEPSYGGPVS